MNTKLLASAALVTLASLGTPTVAAAGISDGLGAWQGQGTTLAVNGADLGAFSVEVTRRSTAPGQVRTDGRVVLANGQVIVFWQESVESPSGGFHMTTNDGSGGGRCFANGMCQSYVERADGHAFATTIVRDAPDKLRILVTELDKGQAVRFIQQSLTKKP
jgi:outer membrane receptor protein involved in Fe transport